MNLTAAKSKYWNDFDWEFLINDYIQRIEALRPDLKGRFTFKFGVDYKKLYSDVLMELMSNECR